MVIETKGYRPGRENLKDLELKVKVNGNEVKFIKFEDNKYFFHLSKDIRKVEDITILSSTFIPKEIGLNNDQRKLGLDIQAIIFKKAS